MKKIRFGIGLGLTRSIFGENSIMNVSNVSLGIAFYALQILAGKHSIIKTKIHFSLSLFLML